MAMMLDVAGTSAKDMMPTMATASVVAMPSTEDTTLITATTLTAFVLTYL